jgi:hypothetical protein
MEAERNTTTQYHQSGESQELPPADQVEVKERGLLDTLLGKKKAPAEDQEKQEEALVSGMENVNVSEPETKHEVKEEHEGGGGKKESLLAKLHRTGSGSSSSSSSDEEEEVIDENGEVVKRKKKGLKEKIKEKLPGGHKDHNVEAEHKPSYTPAPVPTHVHQEAEHKPYAPAPAPAYLEAEHNPYLQAPAPAHVHHQEAEHKPHVPPPAVETHAYKEHDDHKAYIPATAPAAPAPVTTTHVHHDDNATVVQKVEETPEKGLLDKIKEKLPGGHKKPEDTAAATAPATHVHDVSSPDGKDKEKKQGLLGKIMDKIPGYNKTPAGEDHSEPATAAGEHKTSSSS